MRQDHDNQTSYGRNKENFQTAFVRSLLDAQSEVPDFFARSRQSLSVERFNIYRNNVFASLVQALKDGFPVVQRLVGETYFSALALQYAKTHMPQSPVMLEYGASFPAFLADFEPVKSLRYLPDIAQLEWLYNESFHSADAPALTMEMVFEAAQDRLNEIVLTCHPAMRLLNSDYAILSVWQAHKTEIADDDVKMPELDQPEYVLITRPSLTVELRWLGQSDMAFIQALIQGKTLGVASQDILESQPDFNLQHLLTVLFESGAISGFRA